MSVCRHKTINKWQLKIVLDSRMQCGADPFQREPSQKMRGEPSRTPPSSHLGGEEIGTRRRRNLAAASWSEGGKKVNN